MTTSVNDAAAAAQVLSRASDHQRAGNHRESERLCRSILATQGDHFEALNLLGIIVAQSGRHQEAVGIFGRAAAVKPHDARTWNNVGIVMKHLRRLDDALSSYELALQIKPDFTEVYLNRGHALAELKRYDEALADYRTALRLKPDYLDAHFACGAVLQALQRYGEAVEDFDRALMIKPDHADTHNNRGTVLRMLGRDAQALESYERALEIRPDHAEAHSNRGLILHDRLEPAAAIESFDRAIEARPDFATAYNNRAYSKLLAGDLAGGWVDHEWRWKNERSPLFAERSRLPGALWLGREPLAGKRILCVGEQGFGDAIQFCRYVPLVAQRGGTVILEVAAPLRALVATLEGVSQLITRGEPLPDSAYHCPLMSLPLAFGTTLSTIPGQVPYLRAPLAAVRAWQAQLGIKRRLRVGLAWSGGLRPDQPELSRVNHRRNVGLAHFAKLKHPGVEFYSLQKGPAGEAELRTAIAERWNGPGIIDFTHRLNDFSETAALIENLDLVICVDTSIAHLAGALGKPVWILNRFDTCWRWLMNRADSPWYPSARLYRQDAPGDWDTVMQRVRADLIALAS
jgi:tetratricopeptide (TPR) repeat protein